MRLSDHAKYRLLEILPGVLVWSTFIVAIALSFLKPLWAIVFIIVFDLFWLIRILYLLVFLVVSFSRFRRDVRIDWLTRVQAISGWERIVHLVFVPTYREGIEVLRETLAALTRVRYPLGRIIVVLAGEERDAENFRRAASTLEGEFASRFFRFLTTEHPDDVPGELAGKGSNLAWAGAKAKALIDSLGLRYEDVVVSTFDADTVIHPAYLSYLTFKYLTHPRPTRTSYQPVPLFNNNIWESPALMRVVANSTTFWLMTEQLRPERLFTFSSHSMSFRALVDVGFWQSDIVTEDSRIFLQGLIRYDGDYTVTPMYIPLSMDTVMGKTIWRSLKNQYKQQRRWAYGVENFPYMVWNFVRNPRIPFAKKFRYSWNQLEGVYSWATAPILIFALGRLPFWVASDEVKAIALTQNTPVVLQWLMTVAMVGLFLSAILSTFLLPPKPGGVSRWRWVPMILQWVLVPFTLIAFGSIPATDAQTRLMLGRYLGFNVTEKVRKTPAPLSPPQPSSVRVGR